MCIRDRVERAAVQAQFFKRACEQLARRAHQRATTQAVSYTHLDVYKRQGQNYASAAPVAEAVVKVLRKLPDPSRSHGQAKG